MEALGRAGEMAEYLGPAWAEAEDLGVAEAAALAEAVRHPLGNVDLR